jgi:hypothetical protein
MIRKTLSVVVVTGLLLACSLIASTLAIASDEEGYVLVNVWARSEECNPNIAAKVAFKDFLKAPENYKGKCVALRGYYFQRALFIDADDTVVQAASNSPKVAERRMGVYASDEVGQALQKLAQPEYVELVGIAANCDDLSKGNAFMVLGYCHYTQGPIIRLNSFKAMREPLSLSED